MSTESNGSAGYVGPHDLGGRPGGPVDRSDHDHAPWEKEVDALMVLLGGQDRQLITTDELRRAIESLGEDAYRSLSYYERWISAITAILVEKEILTEAEVEARIEAVRAREATAR